MNERIKIENGQIVARIQKSAIKAPSGRMDPMRTSDEDIAAVATMIGGGE